MEIEVSAIRVGRRHRKTLVGVEKLADSIAKIGLLHPVVVLPDHTLVAGERRLAAHKHLGRTTIQVNVAANLTDAMAFLQAERDENVCREPFTPEEAVALAADYQAIAVKQAKENHASAVKRGASLGGKAAGNGRSKVASSKTFTRGKKQDNSARASAVAAAAVGMSHVTLEKAVAVVEAAKAEPARFRPLVDEMNRTGKVDGAFKKLKVARQAEKLEAEPPPLPSGPFRVIVVDPPWEYSARGADPTHRAANPYPSLSIEQIINYADAAGNTVPSIAADDCVLWLWTTNAHLRHAFDIATAWGFQYKTMLTWIKDRMGTGDWLRGQTEHCLMCVKGKPAIRLTNQTTALQAPFGKHSAKPDEFYALIAELCPGSKIEVFSRRVRAGWASHGDEVPRSDQAA